ncbi:MAG: ExbD/TolR family protein, partial [Fibrobacterota bacterium]
MKKSLKKYKEDADVDLIPMMNLFTVLIPFLLACAAFSKIVVLDMDLPPKADAPQPQEQNQSLLLTVGLTNYAITLSAAEAILPQIFVKEFHVYSYQKAGQKERSFDTVEVDQDNLDKKFKNPVTGQYYSLFDREQILLHAVEKESEDDQGKMVQAVYDSTGKTLYLDKKNRPARSARPGDTLYYITLQEYSSGEEEGTAKRKIMKRPVVVTPGNTMLRPLSAYDELAIKLRRIKANYQELEDGDQLKILAEDEMIFDKIVNVMDVGRSNGF